MKYLTSYGGLWRLSEFKYQRFLRRVATGKEWNLDDYGKRIGQIDLNVTDLDAEGAQELLDGAEPEGRLAGVRDENE